MSTMPAVSSELLVVPLAGIGDGALDEFAASLAREPRFFGRKSTPRPSVNWCSMLCHRSRRVGFAALVAGELVGVARLWPRTVDGLDMYVSVAAPWRQMGIGARLVREAFDLTAALGHTSVVAIAEHRKAPVQALARRFEMEPLRMIAGVTEFQATIAS